LLAVRQQLWHRLRFHLVHLATEPNKRRISC
jgi:hypothetical protein